MRCDIDWGEGLGRRERERGEGEGKKERERRERDCGCGWEEHHSLDAELLVAAGKKQHQEQWRRQACRESVL